MTRRNHDRPVVPAKRDSQNDLQAQLLLQLEKRIQATDVHKDAIELLLTTVDKLKIQVEQLEAENKNKVLPALQRLNNGESSEKERTKNEESHQAAEMKTFCKRSAGRIQKEVNQLSADFECFQSMSTLRFAVKSEMNELWAALKDKQDRHSDQYEKARKPSPFGKGENKPEDCREFLARLSLYFHAHSNDYPDDASKCLYAISYLEGSAFSLMESSLETLNRPLGERSRIMSDDIGIQDNQLILQRAADSCQALDQLRYRLRLVQKRLVQARKDPQHSPVSAGQEVELTDLLNEAYTLQFQISLILNATEEPIPERQRRPRKNQ
ncbi:hypothetical protein BGW38_004901 [Lunasporangiospora selenospora]|uniref:Uncharacterized protein n=1 Tax=Lunasporangiospora selenospora TaxID=979761 RepID=A0A9P6FP45_9FUNG|nr:hypothetical protein BGW38_004901 [Lunasporangiospora selenospora]